MSKFFVALDITEPGGDYTYTFYYPDRGPEFTETTLSPFDLMNSGGIITRSAKAYEAIKRILTRGALNIYTFKGCSLIDDFLSMDIHLPILNSVKTEEEFLRRFKSRDATFGGLTPRLMQFIIALKELCKCSAEDIIHILDPDRCNIRDDLFETTINHIIMKKSGFMHWDTVGIHGDKHPGDVVAWYWSFNYSYMINNSHQFECLMRLIRYLTHGNKVENGDPLELWSNVNILGV